MQRRPLDGRVRHNQDLDGGGQVAAPVQKRWCTVQQDHGGVGLQAVVGVTKSNG